MRKRKSAVAILLGLALVGAAACGGDDSGETTTSAAPAETTAAPDTTEAPDDTTETTAPEETTPPETTEPPFVPPARGDADLVIWADDTRAAILSDVAAQFAEDEGINVAVYEVPFDRIRDNLSTAGPTGEGPDIIVGPHDWLGELATNGAVAPFDLGPAADLLSETAVQAFAFDGRNYGLPYASENIALIRNTELVPDAPATFEELVETALALKADGTVEIPLAIQQNPGDPYHNYPLFSGSGGYIFGQAEDGSYIADDLGIDSEGGLNAARNFGQWSADGLLSKDITYDIMIDSFGNGQAPFAITGPWAVNDGDRGFKTKGVPYVVEPIPAFADGTEPKVFIGVQGFMISAFSESQELARTFLLDYVNTDAVQLALFEDGGRPPALLSAFDQVADDPDVLGFGLSGQQGIPQPAIPAMSAVWTEWTNAYEQIFLGNDPEAAFTSAAAAIRAEIG